MFIEVSLKLNPINYLTITKFLEAVNWRIAHVTKRQFKQPLTLSEATIPLLAGNLRSLEFPLFVQYCEHLVLDLPCLLSPDTIQVCVHLSNHFHSALDNWISEAVFTNTLVEAPLWPGLSKSLQDVTWPTCSVVFDAVDITCQVGGVTKRSMSNEMGFFTINALLHNLSTGLFHKPFHPRHLLISIHHHLPINLAPGMPVPTLVTMTVHEAEGEPVASLGFNILQGNLAQDTDMINCRRFLATYLTSQVMNMTH